MSLVSITEAPSNAFEINKPHAGVYGITTLFIINAVHVFIRAALSVTISRIRQY